MEKTIIYDGKKHKTRNVFELYFQGYKFLCPLCKSELLVLPDYNISLKHQRHPGIYCPTNDNHIGVRLFESSKGFWDDYNQLGEKNK